jgi:hypothetical protein
MVDFLLYVACNISLDGPAVVSQHTEASLAWYRFSLLEMS